MGVSMLPELQIAMEHIAGCKACRVLWEDIAEHTRFAVRVINNASR